MLVQPLVRELRSHMPHGQNIKQKQYCNKFNKNFKNDPHPQNNLKKETNKKHTQKKQKQKQNLI